LVCPWEHSPEAPAGKPGRKKEPKPEKKSDAPTPGKNDKGGPPLNGDLSNWRKGRGVERKRLESVSN